MAGCWTGAAPQAWDPEEARKEREVEHKRKEERARRLAEKKAAALARLARMEAAEAATAATAVGSSVEVGASGAEAEGPSAAPESGGRLKRRRTASVDYQALNAQLEAAAAAARAAVGADAPAGPKDS